ncbi:basic leucine zipper [Anaeramoeba flamelloides]|uniref:Basic leucine zipper n=1 Tax=Anaeramoeba flamelloides TaxID=1746091 RepID=A0AAV7ZXM9_9EUKA|nr:basic leucine zipper [Anaeramoeba flamelloides]
MKKEKNNITNNHHSFDGYSNEFFLTENQQHTQTTSSTTVNVLQQWLTPLTKSGSTTEFTLAPTSTKLSASETDEGIFTHPIPFEHGTFETELPDRFEESSRAKDDQLGYDPVFPEFETKQSTDEEYELFSLFNDNLNGSTDSILLSTATYSDEEKEIIQNYQELGLPIEPNEKMISIKSPTESDHKKDELTFEENTDLRSNQQKSLDNSRNLFIKKKSTNQDPNKITNKNNNKKKKKKKKIIVIKKQNIRITKRNEKLKKTNKKKSESKSKSKRLTKEITKKTNKNNKNQNSKNNENNKKHKSSNFKYSFLEPLLEEAQIFLENYHQEDEDLMTKEEKILLKKMSKKELASMSENEKKNRKRARDRLSARRVRLKQQAYVGHLQKHISNLKNENSNLESQLSIRLKEKKQLERQFQLLKKRKLLKK